MDGGTGGGGLSGGSIGVHRVCDRWAQSGARSGPPSGVVYWCRSAPGAEHVV